MAIKIVQNIASISPTISVATTSAPIALKSGYIRVSTGVTAVHVELGGNPIVTENSFFLPPYSAEVIKERIAKQQIAGITTGSVSTIITLPSNAGNPFAIGDYVTIENAQPAGINTIHNLVTSITDETVTITADTSSVVGVITTANATLSRSIKVGALAESSGTTLNITEIVQLVSE